MRKRDIPKCVRERWRRANTLRDFADYIEKRCSYRFAYGQYEWYRSLEDNLVHGYYPSIEGFQDELFDIVTRLRAKAAELEDCS